MIDPLLQVRSLVVSFPSTSPVLGIDFVLYPGEILALVGETGCGKSVSAKAIAGLLPSYAACQGEVLFQGKNLLTASKKMMRSLQGKEIGMIFQDPSSSLNPTMPIGKQMLENYRGPSKKPLQEMIRLLQWVGIQDAHTRIHDYPFQLSGGMRQRVMIAMALAANPKILLADEPTTALDVTIQAQILHILSQIKQDFSTGILLITHDLEIVRHFCDRVLIMEKGKIVESGLVSHILSHPSHPYTQRLLQASEAQLPSPSPSPSLTPAVSLQDLSKTFTSRYRNTQALHPTNIDIYPAETIGIIGESGSGKTTLGRLIMGMEPPSSGKLCFFPPLPPENKAQQMQMIFQDPTSSLNPKMIIKEILEEPFLIHKKNHALSCLHRLLEQVCLSADLLYRFPHELSGGQKQRVCIARALALGPKYLICDEPTSALDSLTSYHILELLQSLQQALSITIVLISHDLKMVKSITNRICVLYAGHLLEIADSQSLYKTPFHPYTQLLLSCLLTPRLARSVEYATNSSGCPFAGRCPLAKEECFVSMPPWKEKEKGHFVRCHFA